MNLLNLYELDTLGLKVENIYRLGCDNVDTIKDTHHGVQQFLWNNSKDSLPRCHVTTAT